MTYLETAKRIANTKVWGQHSLSVGSLLALAIGIVLIILKPLGTWSMWVGIAVIAIGTALF